MAVAAEVSPTQYAFVDSFPEIAHEREAVRAGALALRETRRSASEGGASEDSPLPVDALSAAKSMVEAEARYGRDSVPYDVTRAGLIRDSERLVAEWWRKLRPEYFEPLRHGFDEGRQDFFSDGRSHRRVTENALVPIADNPEEEDRRVNERVEDATLPIVRRVGGVALKGMRIRTISECPDKVEKDYARDMREGNAHQGYGGYVPEVSKIIFRDTYDTDDGSGGRFVEQIAVPGDYLGPIIRLGLARRGLDAEGMDKARLHGAQILAGDDLMEFLALLDEVGSKEWATNLFLGEVVPEGFVKDYAAFRREAVTRQEGQKEMAATVANFVLDLVHDNVDPRKAPAMVEAFVKQMLLDIGKHDHEAAAGMFGEETAKGLREVGQLEAAGRFKEAFARLREVEKAAPGGGYCGAGSCGIERINENSDEGKDIKRELGAESGDTVVKDTERACKQCSKKGSLYYAYSSTKVKKLCTSCGAKESKLSIMGGQKPA